MFDTARCGGGRVARQGFPIIDAGPGLGPISIVSLTVQLSRLTSFRMLYMGKQSASETITVGR